MALLALALACVPPTVYPPPPPIAPPGPKQIACSVDDCCWVDSGEIDCLVASPPAGQSWRGLVSVDWWTCAIGPSVECWGPPGSAMPLQTETPPEADDLAIGTAGGLVLLDGALSSWGSDYFGQRSGAPETAVDIASGYGWGCAIDSGGALECWGIHEGEGAQWAAHDHVDDAPDGASRGFKSIDRGRGRTVCAIDLEDDATCWGETDAWFEDVRDTTSGEGFACAVGLDGSIDCFGAPSGGYEAIACGFEFCCAAPGVCWDSI